jgi:uncharacterized protein (TIGR02284 family)
MTLEETIDRLNELIRVCLDGQKGYLTASESVSNTALKSVFLDYEKQRRSGAQRLKAEVERLDGKPADEGTALAALHRGWMDLKAGVTGGEPAAIIAACETGEDAAEASFERVVNIGISGEAGSVVENEWRKIKESHARLLHMKDEIEKGAEFPKNN